MISIRLAIGAILASAALAAPLASGVAVAKGDGQKPADACFARRDVNGFSAPNDHTVYIRVGVRQIDRLDLMTDCPQLTYRQEFGLEDRPASPWVCSPLDATVVYRETGIPERCPVQAIHKLTEDEMKALPKSDRP
jgi:hypothetical protein